MKDFARSSITYYGLAREKVMNKYPRLISVLVILSLICMTGLAIFLISDLVSFASNPDHKGVLVGLDLKGSENGIVSMTDDKEKSGNIGANSSLAVENLSRKTKEQNSSNLSHINASLPSSQAAKGVIAASKSPSNSSPVKKHHSSSSSSSSSATSAKKSNGKNNLTNETTKSATPTNQSRNNSQRSNDVGSITIPAKDTSARVPVSIIKFKTEATLSPKSEPGLNSGGGDSSLSSNSNNAQSASSQKSKVTAPSQVQKAQEARTTQIANRNRMAENLKKKAAQSRAKAARN